jgi:glycosyltransferase involved in cell wall biosynthesis
MPAELDIVIPVYNEGQNIIPVLESLHRRVKTPFRVLIGYDDENDNTLSAIAQSPIAGLDVVPVRNRGRGALGAVLTGFAQSTAPAVMVLAADDDYNADKIDSMVQMFRTGCDVVVASRFMPGGCMRGCPWLKAMLVRSSAFVLYHVARLPTHDPSNGFRLFSRRLLQRVPIESTKSFAYSIELLVKCHRLGWKIGEIPVAWYERKHGSSRFRVIRWLPQYLVWFFYAFCTTYLFRSPDSVKTKLEVRDQEPAN